MTDNDRVHQRRTREQRQEQKRFDAEARQVEYDKLTTQQKIDCLPSNGALRQHLRLQNILNQENS